MDIVDTLRHNAPISREHYIHRTADEIESLRKERDELLSALKFVRQEVDLSKWVLNTGHTLDDLAKAAITSVKGAE